MQTINTLSVKDVNQQTAIGERTIRAAIDAGQLKAIRLGEKRIRVRPDAVADWLKSLEQGGTA